MGGTKSGDIFVTTGAPNDAHFDDLMAGSARSSPVAIFGLKFLALPREDYF